MTHGVESGTARGLRAVLAHAQSRGRVPSVVGAVARDGQPLWCEGYGDVPGAPTEVQYRIGSITKTMTAVLVLQLVEDGLLALDDTARGVLGEVPFGDRRIGDLLSHLSGMPAEPSGAWWERAGRGDFAELMAAETAARGAMPPGSRYHYSNLAFALLGEVAARLRGSDWWTLVQQRLLTPLGMQRTSYHPAAPAAQGYSVHPYRGELLTEPASDTGAMAPAGQLWSTATDLLRWGQFLLDGNDAVLSQDALAAAYVVRSTTPDGAAEGGHGLGFRTLLSELGPLVGHGGSMPGFLAGCLVDRERRAVAVVLANGTRGLSGTEVAGRLLLALEEAEPALPRPWRPSSPVPDEVSDLLGVWHWGATPHVLSWEGEELVTRVDGAAVWRHQVRDGELVGVLGYQDGERLGVVRGPDGAVRHLELATFLLTRVPYDPSAPIPGGPG